ncbi:MAG: hypothetical protein LBV19_07215 [Streptococcaceae bacterium]|jgi:hypothetical protein|nr:hypothetical protein [Streptococcaceae bacterium]
MKKSKVISLLAVSALSIGILTACSSTSDTKTSTSKSSSVASSSKTDVYTGATVAAKDFDSLQKGFAANGAWLGATNKDMDATGKTLTVEGVFLTNADTGEAQVARKLAIYNQNDNHQVTEQYTLTLDKIVVKSPDFYISNGTVKGNVEVLASGFHAQNGKKTDGSVAQATIEGNLIFASQDLLDEYNKLADTAKVKVTGETKVDASIGSVVKGEIGAITVNAHGGATYAFKGNGSDVQSGATTGTTDAKVLSSALGDKGAWLVSSNGDVDASGKTITVSGIFLNDTGEVQRTLAMIAQNDKRQVTKVFNLTVSKLIVNSPMFDFEGGNVKGDVYVGKTGAILSREMKDTTGASIKSKIDGNLYFSSQDQLDTYNALPDANKFDVTGQVAVKAAS